MPDETVAVSFADILEEMLNELKAAKDKIGSIHATVSWLKNQIFSKEYGPHGDFTVDLPLAFLNNGG
jgi:hypothetical protein